MIVEGNDQSPTVSLWGHASNKPFEEKRELERIITSQSYMKRILDIFDVQNKTAGPFESFWNKLATKW